MKTQPGFVAVWRQVADDAAREYEETYKALAKCNRHKMRASYIMADVYRLQLKHLMALSDEQLSDPDFKPQRVTRLDKIITALKHFWR